MRLKKVVSFLLFSSLTFSSFAEDSGDWYVCLASFKDEKSAMNRMNLLKAHDCPSFAGKIETETGNLIRIFYSKRFKNQASAIKFKNKIENSAELDFLEQKDFWCVQYSGEMFQPNPDYGSVQNPAEKLPVEKVVEVEKPGAVVEVPYEVPVTVIEEVPFEKIVEVEKKVEVVKEIPYEVPVPVIEQVVKEIVREVPVTVIEQREVVKEVVREVPTIVIEEVEKPVEVVKEVVKEVIKEVPVEKIVEVIKEVPVEKIVEVEKQPEEKQSGQKNDEGAVPPEEKAAAEKAAREKALKSKKRDVVVRDSDTGEPVEGATFLIDEEFEVQSDAEGAARIPDEITDGEHSVSISKDGYVRVEQTFTVKKENIASINQFSIPKAVDYERIKISVEWSQGVGDLDARIVVEGTQVYYKNRKFENVRLDRDSRASPGVETISIEKVDSGKIYSFFVTDFDNYNSNSAKNISSSDAKVTVWLNNEYYTTIKPPKNMVGFKWHVFDVVDSEIVLVNTIAAESMKVSVKQSLSQKEAEKPADEK